MRRALYAFGLFLVLGFAAQLLWHPQLETDELHHWGFVKDILNGRFGLTAMRERILPMLPGYHLVLAGLGSLVGPGLRTLRALSFLHALLIIPATVLAARALRSERTTERSLRALLQPWLPPLCWLLYTDVHALIWSLFALALWKQERRLASGVALSLATAIRQNSVVLGVAFIGLDLWKGFREGGSAEATRRLPRNLPIMLPGLAVCAFALWHGDLVVTRTHDAPRSLHLTQLWFALLLLGFLNLPELLIEGRRLIRDLLTPRRLIVLGLGAALYALTLRNDHPWNLSLDKSGGAIDGDDWLLHLWFLHPVTKAAGFVLIALTLAQLARRLTALAAPARHEALALLGCAALMILPSWLLCVRYDLMPLALVALLLPPPELQRRATIAWRALLTLLVAAAVLGDRMFW